MSAYDCSINLSSCGLTTTAEWKSQAADDAMLAILAKLGDFRGESRFITWAYRFVMLEVSSKLGRHYWRNPPVALDAGQWERPEDRLWD